MKHVILITLITTTLAANANYYDYSGTNQYGQLYNMEIDSNLNALPGGGYNTSTGSYTSIDNIRPNGQGGLTGETFDYGTGRFGEINIDSSGYMDIWEY